MAPNLENSPGAQPDYANLMTHVFTTILHGHHLLFALAAWYLKRGLVPSVAHPH